MYEIVCEAWEDFDVELRELLVEMVLKSRSVTPTGQLPAWDNLLRESFDTDNKRRILRHPGLDQRMDWIKWLTSPKHSSPERPPKTPSVHINDAVRKWLEDHLIAYRVDFNVTEQHWFLGLELGGLSKRQKEVPELDGFWEQQKESLMQDKSLWLVATGGQDLVGLREYLCQEIRENKTSFVTHLCWSIVSQHVNESCAMKQLLAALSVNIAEQWIHLLCIHPEAFLDIEKADQRKVANLLCWKVGSRSLVETLLLQRDVIGQHTSKVVTDTTKPDDESDNTSLENEIYVEEVEEKSEATSDSKAADDEPDDVSQDDRTHLEEAEKNRVLLSKLRRISRNRIHTYLHDASIPEHPDRLWFHDWLSIRPALLENTHIIIEITETLSSAAIAEIVRLAEYLESRKIFLKIISANPTPSRSTITRISIDYIPTTSERLREELERRKLLALFAKDAQEDTLDLLIAQTQSSLPHILMLIHQALETHVRNRPDVSFLTLEDIQDVL